MKYRPIFITATNTDIGKTYATCMLIEEFSNQGLRVGILKPIETGVKSIPQDGELLLKRAKKYNSALAKFSSKDIVPVQYALPASPFVAKKGKKLNLKAIHVAFEKMAKISDIILIEGAGGLMVPVDNKFYMYDFIKEFNAVTLLVTHARLGCINDTLLNLNFLDSLGIDYEWCVNFRNNYEEFSKISLPYYKKIISLQDEIKLLSKSLLK